MTWAPDIQYFVETQNGEWTVRRDGKRYGPYMDRAAAVRQAVDAAQTSGRNDRPAQVLVQGEDSAFTVEWIYGDHSYPPHALREQAG